MTSSSTLPPGSQNSTNSYGLAGFIIALVSPLGCGLLSLVGIVVSVIGTSRQPRGLAITGLVLSIITGSAWVAGWWLGIDAMFSTIQQFGRSSATGQVWAEAALSAAELGKKRPQEQSGRFPGMSVYDQDDNRIPIEVSWTRSGEEYTVTAAMVGPLPASVEKTTARVDGLPGGKLAMGFPELREWAKANQGMTQDVTRPQVLAIIDAMEPEVDLVTAWVKSNDDRLPDDQEGSALFTDLPRIFTLSDGRGSTRINSVTYTRKGGSEFTLNVSYVIKLRHRTMSSTTDFTFTRDGRMVDPFDTFIFMGFFFDRDGDSKP